MGQQRRVTTVKQHVGGSTLRNHRVVFPGCQQTICVPTTLHSPAASGFEFNTSSECCIRLFRTGSREVPFEALLWLDKSLEISCRFCFSSLSLRLASKRL